MNGLNHAKGLVVRVRRAMCLMLTAGLVVITGLPIPVATAGTVPLLRGESQSCPYIDRNTAPARIEELTGRLAERRKAIEKTKGMLPGLQAGSREAWGNADRFSEEPAKLITSLAGDYLKKTKIMKDSITALRKSSGLSTEKLKKIDSWLETMEELEEAGSFLEQAPTSFEAGKKFGLNHQAEMTNLQNEFVKANDLFVESGLAEELGGTFATAIGGPLGKLAFDVSVTSINLVAATEEAFIDAGAAQRVQSAVRTMEWAYSRDYEERYNLAALLASDCGKPKEKVAESKPSPEPPPPSVAQEAPVTTAPVSAASAGPDMGPIILLGGAAAAAGVAAIALGGIGTTADCGPAPFGFGNTWFYNEYEPWCECTGGTADVATGTCN